MENKKIIKTINDVLILFEGVPAYTHDVRKNMVAAEEMLIMLAQELEKEEKAKNNEKGEFENADKDSTNK